MSAPGSAPASGLRLFYVVTVVGDYIFAATDEQGAKLQSIHAVAYVREATDKDIAYVRHALRGNIPSLPA